MIIYGFHTIYSYLINKRKINLIFFNKYKINIKLIKILELAKNLNIKLLGVNDNYLFKISKTYNHQNIVAEIIIKKYKLNEIFENINYNSLFLILDGIKDHNNLGSCFRIASSMGVDAIISSKNRTINLNSVSIKISSGASAEIPYILVNNLISFIKKIKNFGFKIIGLTEHSNEIIYNYKFFGPLAIIIGSENNGMRNLTEKFCNNLLKIPTLGNIKSLNVSIAVCICLYEILKQRAFK